MTDPAVRLVDVFAASPNGGNPAPIVINADGMSDADMQQVARQYGHESGFVLSAPAGSGHDFEFRFWVPNHEMEMCGHATVGAVWLLYRSGRLPRNHVVILTRSGRVEARVTDDGHGDTRVEITQPRGRVEAVPEERVLEVLEVLGVPEAALATDPIRNACTSRVKTLVPLRSLAILDGLQPDFSRMEQLCEQIGSTGLYPYAAADSADQVFEARQFPKSSGYPEDAATGIAAAALAFGLLDAGRVTAAMPVLVRQGRAMGRTSKITVKFRTDTSGTVCGCWLGGHVRYQEA
ncbi:MAG: PhzF family phenazine biosynthesis protein [Janthinobacterium lividum]